MGRKILPCCRVGFPLFILFIFQIFFNIAPVAAVNKTCVALQGEGINAYQNVNYDAAIEKYTAARECFLKESGGEETAGSATCLHGIGLVYDKMGDYEKALENYNLALGIRIKILGEEHPVTAGSYSNIGTVYYEMGDYEKALENYNIALVIKIKTIGREHQITATSYNNIGAVYLETGDYEKALENYSRALGIRTKALGEEHPDTAGSYNNIGLVYKEMGAYEKALENYNRALEIRLKTLGQEHPSVANSYNNIGTVYYEMGDYEKAIENHNRALGIYLKALGQEHPSVANSYNNIGTVYYEMGAYEKALENYNLALGIRIKTLGEEHPDIANSYNNIGLVYKEIGAYEKALENYNGALGVRLKTFGEEHPDTATSYNNIGLVYYEMGDYEKVLENHNRALGIYLNILGEEHPLTAKSYNNIGLVYYEMGDYEKALENHNRALGIRLKALGEEHPDVAGSYNNIGKVYYEMGEYEKALENHNRALGMRIKTFGEVHPLVANSYNNIGKVYYKMDDYEKALENYNLALGIRIKSFGEEHHDTAESYNNKGLVYYEMGDYEKALQNHNYSIASMCGSKDNSVTDDCRPEADTVRAFWFAGKAEYRLGNKGDAVAYYVSAAEALEKLRGAMQTESAKIYQSAGFYELFPEGVGIFADAAEESGDAGIYEKALMFSEKGIGRIFMEMIGRSRALVDGGLPSDVIQEGIMLKAKWQAAIDTVQKIESQPKDKQSQAERTAAYEQLQQADADFEAYEARRLHDYPDYAELMNPQTRPLSIIREKVIATDEAALEYILGEDGSYLIFITKDKIVIKALPKLNQIENLVNIFRNLLTSSDSDTDKLKQKGADLYEILIRPVEEYLVGIDRLLIVPTGELYFLPFESLTIKADTGTNFLIEKYEIRYAPSLNVMYLTEMRKDRKASERENNEVLLGFGDPVYDDKDTRAGSYGFGEETNDMMVAYSRALSDGSDDSGAVWQRIPGTGEEIVALQEVAGESLESVNINLGIDASEKNFKQLAPDGYRFIHVASHGTLGEGGANQPALVLSLVGNEGTGEDGFLTMTEIINMKTPADMIVLSACKTGQGKMEKGEGVAGMSRAFLYSGADSLVVSLWNVADQETKDLMVDFYEKMIGGMNRESALRKAKIEMIKQGLHPYYWAPFIYIGVN